MGLFKSKEEKMLDDILNRLRMNMANNYKDNAQDNLTEFKENLTALEEAGKLKGKNLEKYKATLTELEAKMKGYSHKDQKPYWT